MQKPSRIAAVPLQSGEDSTNRRSRPHAIALLPPPGVLLLVAVVALTGACGNSGSGTLNFNIAVPATQTATETPGAPATDTPLAGAPTPTDTPAPEQSATPAETPPGASETPTPTSTPTPMILAGQPDLVPGRIVVIAPTPVGGCINGINDVDVSMEVCVVNQGAASAGPFDADLIITGAITVSFSGADAGVETCMSAPLVSGQVVFQVDPRNEVEESDESNNEVVVAVERPTLPPICPTPAA